MAKKKRKSKKRASEDSPGLRPWAMPAAWAEHPHLARTAAITLGIGLLSVGICLGMGRLESRVHRLPRYEQSLALEWQDLPDWLQLPENRHILHTLTRKLDLLPTDHLLDAGLAPRLGAALADAGIGWIDSVDRIMVRPDGVVSVRCRFRRPAAWVRREDSCYLVDANGIRLPGRYQPADCVNSALMTIAGVRLRPPAVGHLWEGADLGAGLTMAGMISKHPFRRQVDLIIVTNHDGRVDRDRPYIELATDRPGSRIWWGRPPNQEYGTEISAPQKLALLDSLYRRWQRIDLNRAYVDVRTHPNSVVLPAAGR